MGVSLVHNQVSEHVQENVVILLIQDLEMLEAITRETGLLSDGIVETKLGQNAKASEERFFAHFQLIERIQRELWEDIQEGENEVRNLDQSRSDFLSDLILLAVLLPGTEEVVDFVENLIHFHVHFFLLYGEVLAVVEDDFLLKLQTLLSQQGARLVNRVEVVEKVKLEVLRLDLVQATLVEVAIVVGDEGEESRHYLALFL